MEVLLLQDIPGVGKKNDLLVVGDGFALNFLLPKRAALVATPIVRKRYAEFIKRRAQEREQEKAVAVGMATALSGKILTISRKASKAGKLYAAVTAKNIADTIREQHEVSVAEESVMLDEPIKTTGSYQVPVQVADQSVQVTVSVLAEKETK